MTSNKEINIIEFRLSCGAAVLRCCGRFSDRKSPRSLAIRKPTPAHEVFQFAICQVAQNRLGWLPACPWHHPENASRNSRIRDIRESVLL
jgi:hypothetical protein